MPDHLTDDQITDALATEIAARVRASHPHASGHMLRQLVRLYTRQALGLAPPPGRITDAELGEHLGGCHRRISETRARALARAWQVYQTRFPDLL